MILYASALWTTTSKENLNKVLKLQKRAAWVILDLDTSARSVNMFKQLNWIPYDDEVHEFKIFIGIIATTAYKRINSESPDYLANMLKLNSCVNSTTVELLDIVISISYALNISERLKDTFAVLTDHIDGIPFSV